jgi:hypothetical protein
MLKHFTRILLLTMVLTIPLSCCGEECPDFKPAFEINEIYRNKSSATVVVQRKTVTLALPAISAASRPRERKCPPPLIAAPRSTHLNLPLHERAPPKSISAA